MKKNIICIDRDGTLIYDSKEHLFLGREPNWQAQVRFFPQVLEGLNQLRQLPNTSLYMITNQAGVAVSDYPELTEVKAHEVCAYVLDQLKAQGVTLDGYFLCPHATPTYVATRPDLKFNQDLVHECTCLKPALGMVMQVLDKERLTIDNINLFVIGDRASDVETALNAKGTGILVPFENEPNEKEKIKQLKDLSSVRVADDFLMAAAIIINQLK